MCERVAESVKDRFGFEVPEGLELEPFCNVRLELEGFEFNQGEGALESIVGEVSELGEGRGGFNCRRRKNKTTTHKRRIRRFSRYSPLHL